MYIPMNLDLYFKDNLEIDNFIARGDVKEMNGVINKDLSLENTSFNFFADNSDILIKNIKSEMDGLKIKKGNLQIKRNQEIILKSDFITDIKINNKNIGKYLPYLKNTKFFIQIPESHIKVLKKKYTDLVDNNNCEFFSFKDDLNPSFLSRSKDRL